MTTSLFCFQKEKSERKKGVVCYFEGIQVTTQKMKLYRLIFLSSIMEEPIFCLYCLFKTPQTNNFSVALKTSIDPVKISEVQDTLKCEEMYLNACH